MLPSKGDQELSKQYDIQYTIKKVLWSPPKRFIQPQILPLTKTNYTTGQQEHLKDQLIFLTPNILHQQQLYNKLLHSDQ